MPDEATTIDGSAVAVAERPDGTQPVIYAEPKIRRKKKEADDTPEYEITFDTPFGSMELEVEPKTNKEKRELRKREEAAASAAKAAEKAAKRAAKHPERAPGESRGHGLLIAFVLFSLVAAAIAVAYWLFAQPDDDDRLYMVPDDLRNPEMEPATTSMEPQGFMANVRSRIKSAVRDGRRASRDAQEEQERRYREMTRR